MWFCSYRELTQHNYFRVCCVSPTCYQLCPLKPEFSTFWSCGFCSILSPCQTGSYLFQNWESGIHLTYLRKTGHWIICQYRVAEMSAVREMYLTRIFCLVFIIIKSVEHFFASINYLPAFAVGAADLSGNRGTVSLFWGFHFRDQSLR